MMEALNISLNQSKKGVETLVLGRSFVKPDYRSYLVETYQADSYRDAMLVKLDDGELWVFDYGVLISWGVATEKLNQLIEELSRWVEEPAFERAHEHFHYILNEDQPFRIHNDQIQLPMDNAMVRLAASHALAQSTKLGFFEHQAERVISGNAYLSKTLAKTGRIPLSRRQLAKLRGTLFETTSDISLHFNLLDTPEFFWNYPELEPYYQSVAKYLDLAPRIELLNHKLSIIHELVDMLASEQNHKHSAFLEWVIIVLITVDIVIYFL